MNDKHSSIQKFMSASNANLGDLHSQVEEFHKIYGLPELKNFLQLSKNSEKMSVNLIFLMADFLQLIDEPNCLKKLADLCKGLEQGIEESGFWLQAFSMLALCETEVPPSSDKLIRLQKMAGKNHLQRAFAEYIAACSYFRTGFFVRALSPLQRSLDLLEEKSYPLLSVWGYRLKSIIENELGQIHDSIMSCRSALQIANASGLISRFCELNNQLALSYLKINDLDRCNESLATAKHYAERTGSEYLKACSKLESADEKMFRSDWAGAIEDLKTCVDVFGKLKNQEKLIYAYFDCFRAYKVGENWDSCHSILTQISSMIKGVADVGDLRLQVIRANAELALHSKDYTSAIKIIDEGMVEQKHLRESSAYLNLEIFRSDLIIRKLIEEHQLIRTDQLLKFESEARTLKISVVSYLIKNQMIIPSDYFKILIENFNYEVAGAQDYQPVSPELRELIPLRFASDNRILPIVKKDGILQIIISDPLDVQTLRSIRLLTEAELRVKIDDAEHLKSQIAPCYSVASETLFDKDSQACLDNILKLAGRAKASDIHIFPDFGTTVLQFRIDGVLQHVEYMDVNFHGALVNCIKLRAELDLTIHSVPQDGRFEFGGNSFRVSTIPLLDGEKIVIRVSRSTITHLERLGMEENILREVKKVSQRSGGIFLVTGPTGSGKTSTLYAILNELNDYRRSIATVEDPIENNLQNMAQTQINLAKGYTFEKALSAFLRQDPDIILVGEIRDKTTAEIAVRASLTGIMVFSTLHTYNSYASINRLKDLGISPYLLAESLQAVLCQRLIRRLCSFCKEPSELDIDKYDQFRRYLEEQDGLESFSLFKEVGCEHCEHLGFSGRTLICEWLPINELARDLILSSSQADQFENYFKTKKLMTLARSGFFKVLRGESTFQEVLRVL